jgi:hypothetical protein
MSESGTNATLENVRFSAAYEVKADSSHLAALQSRFMLFALVPSSGYEKEA